MPFVYIVECADGSYYTGWTMDLARRVGDHNAGRGGRYTRGCRPVGLVYWEAVPDRSAAQRGELVIKRAGRKVKELLIAAAREQQATDQLTPHDVPGEAIAEDKDA